MPEISKFFAEIRAIIANFAAEFGAVGYELIVGFLSLWLKAHSRKNE